MALDRLTKVDGGGISTTSDYRVGIITASKFVGPIEGVVCLLYTSPSPRDRQKSRMPSSA